VGSAGYDRWCRNWMEGGGMVKHICEESRTCQCYALADEPNEKCPVHGCGEWPPRCEICGRFMKRRNDERLSKHR
jgi:hypothetical protein